MAVCFLLLLTSGTYAQSPLFPYRLYTKWGYADMNGQLVIPAKYDWASRYEGNYAVVKLKGKKGLIDSAGKVVLPLTYDDIEPETWENKTWYTLKTGDKYGLANAAGKLVLPAKYSRLNFERNAPYAMAVAGNDIVKVTPDGAVQKGTIADWKQLNSMGEKMVSGPPYTDLVQSFTLNGKKGYLVKRRRPGFDTIPAIYDDIDESNYYENVLRVKKDGRWAVIGPKNNIIFPFLYEEIGSASVDYNFYSGKKNGKYGILKANGEVLVPFEWDKLNFSNDGFWGRLYKNEKEGIFILDGNTPVFIQARYKNVLGNPVSIVEYQGRKYRFFDVETEQGYGYVREDGMEYFKDGKPK